MQASLVLKSLQSSVTVCNELTNPAPAESLLHFPTPLFLFPLLHSSLSSSPQSILALLLSAVTTGYALTSKHVELGNTDERESVVFVFLGLGATFNTIFSSTIHLPTNFIFLYEKYCIVCMQHIFLSIHLAEGHLVYFDS